MGHTKCKGKSVLERRVIRVRDTEAKETEREEGKGKGKRVLKSSRVERKEGPGGKRGTGGGRLRKGEIGRGEMEERGRL